jgi:hypothetical protein
MRTWVRVRATPAAIVETEKTTGARAVRTNPETEAVKVSHRWKGIVTAMTTPAALDMKADAKMKENADMEASDVATEKREKTEIKTEIAVLDSLKVAPKRISTKKALSIA